MTGAGRAGVSLIARVATCGVLFSPLSAQAFESGAAPFPPAADQNAAARAAEGLYLDGGFGVLGDGRVEAIDALSVEIGLYAERIRLSARATGHVDVASQNDYLPDGYRSNSSYVSRPLALLELGIGYAVFASDGFVLAPGLFYRRAQDEAFGSAAGLRVPVVWVTRTRVRIGFEVGYYAAFGGTAFAECATSEDQPCEAGTVRELALPLGTGFSGGLVLGIELMR